MDKNTSKSILSNLIRFPNRITYMIDNLSQEDKEYVDRTTAFINDDSFDEHYNYAGKFAIASTEDQWRKEFHPCCGQYRSTIVCPSGRHVVFCFDYGH